jgi:flagellar biogenesis protein FliO
MTKPTLTLAYRACFLVGLLLAGLAVANLGSLRADETEPSQGPTNILARLPIGFRLVDRGPHDRPRPATNKSAEMLPLAPRGRSSAPAASGSPPTAGRAIATVASSLAVVAGLLVVVTWFARRYHPAAAGLPKEVFLHLGTTNLAGRQAIHVMRFGDKLLLVAAGPTGLQPLAELTDIDDVQRLTALCRPTSSNPISSTFQRVVADWSRESTQTRPPARAARSNGASVATSPRMGETSHA